MLTNRGNTKNAIPVINQAMEDLFNFVGGYPKTGMPVIST